jgi:predicted Na+-dependent transporter
MYSIYEYIGINSVTNQSYENITCLGVIHFPGKIQCSFMQTIFHTGRNIMDEWLAVQRVLLLIYLPFTFGPLLRIFLNVQINKLLTQL